MSLPVDNTPPLGDSLNVAVKDEQLSTATCLTAPRNSVKAHGVSAQQAQALRRQRHLEAQQQRKQDYTAQLRRLVSFDNASTDSEDEVLSDTEKDVVEDTSLPNPKKHRSKTPRKRVKRQPLMEGESINMLPTDLSTDWYATLCPVGKRCWVVSVAGRTISRLRNGATLANFESILPAGSRAYRGNRSSDYCILDCIYVEQTFTYYILDLMCWKGHPFFNCDTEFRLFWLQTQLADLVASGTQQAQLYKFEALPSGEATLAHLEQIVQQISIGAEANETNPDGVLLVHRRTHYVPGRTPLCGWIPASEARHLLTSFITDHSRLV
ncbi:hypothetical protein BDF19DRAFT_446869 [Syncephalis fuscata]|nr:hypothetical protein BDF19DRAFT_446869 [Syncephalis fuscata]